MHLNFRKCDLIFNQNIFKQLDEYLDFLKENDPGENLKKVIIGDFNKLSNDDLLKSLLKTKKPRIYAEREVLGNGHDWNIEELKILGNICAAFQVIVYDDGKHENPKIYKKPINFTYVFVPGALLRNDLHSNNNFAVDRDLLSEDRKINFDKFFKYYSDKLYPVLSYINKKSLNKNKKAFISIPGLGCGQFAAEFKGKLGNNLKECIVGILQNYGDEFSNIHTVHFDPYNECKNESLNVNGINLNIKPLLLGEGHPQLSIKNFSHIKNYENNLDLFTIVAWDHVSWPGNDFYENYRTTDDGVKSAASNLMSIITGQKGEYRSNCYLPLNRDRTWESLIKENKISCFWE